MWRLLVMCPMNHQTATTAVRFPLIHWGTLTGDVSAYLQGINKQEYDLFMADAQRIRRALSREILPEQEDAIKTLTYWQQTATLTGEDLLASRNSPCCQMGRYLRARTRNNQLCKLYSMVGTLRRANYGSKRFA